MKSGMTISCAGHALALGFAVIAISAQPMDSPPVETLATQIISEKDFSQMTKGVKNAPQLKIPDLKPLADRVDQEKSVDQLAPKAADKPAITTDASKSSPPPKQDTPKPDPKTAAKADPKPPDPKPPDPKPDLQPDAKADPKPDPKPDQKQADKPKTPEYKPDQIAKLLKKDAAKDNSAQQNKDSPKFDANQVAQLLDQRAPQRQLAAASQLNDVASLGAATAPQGAQLSQSEIDALKAALARCWTLPPGVTATTNIRVKMDVFLRQDGRLASPPEPVGGSVSALGPALAESAKRALFTCQPFSMFKPEHYDQWKFLELEFNPSDVFGG